MGVSSTTNRLTFVGDGSSTSFSFPYYFFRTSDLLVLKYDTLLGGITDMILGTDYTVSGTPTYEGVYLNGANVVCTVAPLTTDILVVVRNPPETQGFSVLENGIIPSSTLVQQFDYLTLLIQRLEDQMSRSIGLPDGVGSSFDTQLPGNIALYPNSYLKVNSSGDGFTLTGQTLGSVVIPYSAFTGLSGASGSVPAFSLPAGACLEPFAIKHSVAFSGTSITAVQASLGVSGFTNEFINDFDVKQNVGDQAFYNTATSYIGSWANPTNILLTLDTTGADLSALGAGAVTVYFQAGNF